MQRLFDMVGCNLMAMLPVGLYAKVSNLCSLLPLVIISYDSKVRLGCSIKLGTSLMPFSCRLQSAGKLNKL